MEVVTVSDLSCSSSPLFWCFGVSPWLFVAAAVVALDWTLRRGAPAMMATITRTCCHLGTWGIRNPNQPLKTKNGLFFRVDVERMVGLGVNTLVANRKLELCMEQIEVHTLTHSFCDSICSP